MPSHLECVNQAIRAAILGRLPGFKGAWTFKVPEKEPLLLTDNMPWKAFLGDVLSDTGACIAPCRTPDIDAFEGYRAKQLWELQKKIIDAIECPPFADQVV